MANPSVSIDSDALRVNAPHTAQQVEIPAHARILLEAVESYVGVLAAVTETLEEYYHSFRNLDSVVAGLASLQLRYWSYYQRSEAHHSAFSLVKDMSGDTADEQLDDEQFSSLLRSTLMWLRSEAATPDLDAPAAEVLTRIGAHLDSRPGPFLERDTVLRELVLAVELVGRTAASSSSATTV